MRGWLLALVPAIAAADPPPPNPPATIVRPVEPPAIPSPDPNRLPGATPGTGVIITPPADFPDARDYPLGMVIRPTFRGDDAFVITPGAIAESARGFGRRLQDIFGALRPLFEQH